MAVLPQGPLHPESLSGLRGLVSVLRSASKTEIRPAGVIPREKSSKEL